MYEGVTIRAELFAHRTPKPAALTAQRRFHEFRAVPVAQFARKGAERVVARTNEREPPARRAQGRVVIPYVGPYPTDRPTQDHQRSPIAIRLLRHAPSPQTFEPATAGSAARCPGTPQTTSTCSGTNCDCRTPSPA